MYLWLYTKTPIKIAVTGPMGSGKSTIAQALNTLGVPSQDADKICAELINHNHDVRGRIASLLGIEEKNLSKIVIKDAIIKGGITLLKQVESILHPKVLEAIKNFFANYKNKPFLCVEVPLLFESRQDQFFDYVIVAKVCDDLRRTRIAKVKTLGEPMKAIFTKRQWSQQAQISLGDFTVDTGNISLSGLTTHLKTILSDISKLEAL